MPAADRGRTKVVARRDELSTLARVAATLQRPMSFEELLQQVGG